MRQPLSPTEAESMGRAMQAERETLIAFGMRITYLPGPIDRNARGMTMYPGDDTKTFDGAWKCCDGVFCNSYPDIERGRASVLDWVTDHLHMSTDANTGP